MTEMFRGHHEHHEHHEHHGDGCHPSPWDHTSFRSLVRSLLTETVAVELSGNDTTKIGKLVDVDPDFITVAVTDTTGTGGRGGGRSPIHLAFIPFRHIVSIVES